MYTEEKLPIYEAGLSNHIELFTWCSSSARDPRWGACRGPGCFGKRCRQPAAERSAVLLPLLVQQLLLLPRNLIPSLPWKRQL